MNKLGDWLIDNRSHQYNIVYRYGCSLFSSIIISGHVASPLTTSSASGNRK